MLRRRAGLLAFGAVLPAFALFSVATADVRLNDISQSLADSESAVINVLGNQTTPTTLAQNDPVIVTGAGVTATTTLDGQLIDVLAIGDSVMLGAARELSSRGATVDALKSRPVRQALEIDDQYALTRHVEHLIFSRLNPVRPRSDARSFISSADR